MAKWTMNDAFDGLNELTERKRRVPRSKWLLADWQKSDIELAEQFGVSRQAVNVQRMKFKKLEAINNSK